MNAQKIFKFLLEKIHTVVVATNNGEKLPVTCAIDIMNSDEGGLYFLTAKGKNLYKRLTDNDYLSFTGIKGENTLSCVAVSVCGKVKEVGREPLQRMFNKNPYMNEIYPTEESRSSLTVFYIYQGNGEWFDLSKKPIERFSFVFGDNLNRPDGYFINDGCCGCGECLKVCPQNCIVFKNKKAFIKQNNCLHCGNCFNICPNKSVERR